MKIGKERIKGLVQKNTAGGLRYYWEPDHIQRKAGWKTLTLPADLIDAMTAARARNAELDQWREGGGKPAQVKRFVKRHSFGHVLDRYEAEVLAGKSADTRRVDMTAINRLRSWGGDMPFHWVTRTRVKALRDGALKNLGHSPAFHLLTTLRKICGWWIREADLATTNPALEFGLQAPPPRDQIWALDAQDLLIEAAHALGRASIALAFEIGTYTGQREADILHLPRARWKEITLQQLDGDQQLHDRLRSNHGPNAGKVMGIHVHQRKTGVWVGPPIEGALRDRIEAAIAADVARDRVAGALGRRPIVINEATGRPWTQSDFIHKFAEVRDAAWAVAVMDGNDDLAERLADLQFRDLRRTCIVTLGMLNLND